MKNKGRTPHEGTTFYEDRFANQSNDLFFHTLLFAVRSLVFVTLCVWSVARGLRAVIPFVFALGIWTIFTIFAVFAVFAIRVILTIFTSAVGTIFIPALFFVALGLCLWANRSLCDSRHSYYRSGGNTCQDEKFLHVVLSLKWLRCKYSMRLRLKKPMNLIFLKKAVNKVWNGTKHYKEITR